MKKSSQQPHDSKLAPTCASKTDEGSLDSALDLIWRVLCGRRYAIPDDDLPDIVQEAGLRLWKWREKYHEKAAGMTKPEWDLFTAKTAHNEINRHFSNRRQVSEVPLDDTIVLRTDTPEGDTDFEMVSLIRNVWQEICKLTQYQRRALLLGSPELIIYLVQFGIGEIEVVLSLEITEEEWADISGRLPLSDREIAAIARSSKTIRDPASATRAIGKARFDARRRLERLRK